MSDTIKYDGYVKSFLKTKNKFVVYSYYTGLGASYFLCCYFLLKTKHKKKAIVSKESYSRISVWMLHISGLNLVVQLIFNGYQTYMIICMKKYELDNIHEIFVDI